MTTQVQRRAVTERRQLDNTVLHANLVGGLSTGVLVWNVAATANSGLGGWASTSWLTELNDPTAVTGLGTVLTLRRRGMYHIALGATIEASGSVALGISLNSALLTSATNPINGTAGILLGQDVDTPAATQTGINLAVLLPVSDTQAGVGAVIRFHGNDGAAGIIAAADIIEATTRYTLTYVGDVMGV
jgi:hypothetical protein